MVEFEGGIDVWDILSLTAASAAGAGVGAYIPPIVGKVAGFKCRQYGKPFLRNSFSGKSRVLVILLTAALAALSVWCVPLSQAPFYIGFCVIAIVGTLIDTQIRMIPNELVLLLFALGLGYRLMVAGFAGLLHSLLASLITAGIFLLAAGTTFVLKKSIGVGAGDLKLAMAISFIVGLSEIYLFLFGMVASLLVYCLAGLCFRKLTVSSTFPMCGQIMAGFVFTLFAPHLIPGLAGYLLLPV